MTTRPKVKRHRDGFGYRLTVPGRDGELFLLCWSYQQGQAPVWFERGKCWHLTSKKSDLAPLLRIESFRYVHEAERFVAELAGWAAAIESQTDLRPGRELNPNPEGQPPHD